MKIMSRNFTLKESILIIVLALVLVGLFYYQFVDRVVRDSINSSNAEYDSLRTDLDSLQARLGQLTSIQQSMDALEAEGNLSWMGSYNNSKEEVAFLNDILADTLQYSISFANVTRTGNQIRRSFSLNYRTRGYKAARDIMIKLLEGKNRCLVGDVRCAINSDGTVNMSQSATFYETMVGGEADASLPASGASANS